MTQPAFGQVTPETEDDRVTREMMRRRKARLNGSLDLASEQEPQHGADAIESGFDISTSPEVLKEAQRRRQRAEVETRQIEKSRVLSSFLQDPTHATAAYADLGILGRMAGAMRLPADPDETAPIGEVLSARIERGGVMVRRADAAYALLKEESPANLSDFEMLEAEFRATEVPEGSVVAEFLGPAAENLPLLGQTAGAGAVGFAGGALAGGTLALVAGQLGPQAAIPEELVTVPAAAVTVGAVTGKAAAATRIFTFEAGNSYAELRALRDENGDPLDPMVTKGAAVVVGGINAGLEFLSLTFLMRLIPGGQQVLSAGTSALRRKAMGEALKNPSMRQAMARIGVNWLKAVGVEGATETTQNLVNQSAEQLLDETLGSGTVPFRPMESLHEGGQGAMAAAVIGGVASGGSATVSVAEVTTRARRDARVLATLEKLTQESTLRETLPQTFEELVTEMGAEADVENVYIPAKRLIELSEAGDLDLSVLSEPVRKQLQEASITGGDAIIPLGEYLSRVPESIRNQLVGESKLSVDGLSPSEADALEKVLQRDLEGAQEEATGPGQTPFVRSRIDSLSGLTGAQLLGNVRSFVSDPEALSDFSDAFDTPVNFNPDLPPDAPARTRRHELTEAQVKAGVPPATIELGPHSGSDTLIHEMAHAARIVKGRPIAGEARAIAEASAQRAEGFRERLRTAPLPASSSIFADLPDQTMQKLVAAEQKVTEERLAVQTQTAERQRQARDAGAKARAKKLADEKERIRPEVQREIGSQPVWRARAWLATGQLTHEEDLRNLSGLRHTKLDRALLLERYGADIVAALPQNTLIARGGVDPRVVAELFGFSGPDSFLDALMETKGGVQEAVKLEVGLRASNVVEADPTVEPVSDLAADDALMDLLALQEEILAGKDGKAPLARQVLRSAAQAIIGEKPIKDLRPGQYRVAASRQAIESLSAGENVSEALLAKRREMLNRFLDQAVKKRRTEVAKDVAALRKFNEPAAQKRIGKALGTFQEQRNALLGRFELRRSLRKLERTQSFAAWLNEQEQDGERTAAIPQYLREEAEGLALKTHWRNLTPNQLRDVRQSAESITHLAKLKTDIQFAQETRELQAIEEDLKNEIRENVKRKAKRSPSLSPTNDDDRRSVLRGIDASLVVPEFMVDLLGAQDPNSTWRRVVMDAMTDAQDSFNEDWDAYGLKVSELMEAYDRKTQGKYREVLVESRLEDVDGRPLNITKWNVLMMYLNNGNLSNRDKMLRGYASPKNPQGWDPGTYDAVIRDHMLEEDYKWAQGVWNTIGELWPRIAELERKLTGVVPPKVQSHKVETPFGTFSGGYFPVVYDPTRSQLAETNEIIDLFSMIPNGFARATTGHGFTEARTQVARPVLFETSVISSHLHDVLMDLNFREPLLRVHRVLKREGLDSVLKEHLGQEFDFKRFWLPWLQSIAGQSIDGNPIKVWHGFIRDVRLNATVYKLGLRATTLVMQTGGHFNGYRMLREAFPDLSNAQVAKFWSTAVWDATTDIQGDLLAEILRESVFMRNRVKSYDRDVRDVMKRAQVQYNVSNDVRDFAMGLIGHVQLRTVDKPIWLAAKRMGKEIHNLSGPNARRFADSIVRKSQASGEVLSQSAVLRDANQFWRAMTTFYSYSAAVYNQLRFAGRIATITSLPTFFGAYLFYQVLPELWAETVRAVVRALEGRGEGGDDPRRLLAKAAEVALPTHTVPIARDVLGGSIAAALDPKQSFRLEGQGALGILGQEAARIVSAVNSAEAGRLMVAAARVVSIRYGIPSDWMLSLIDRAVKED